MAYMHNIWFNEAKKVYQLAKLPEHKLEDIVSEFQIISRNHQETSLT